MRDHEQTFWSTVERVRSKYISKIRTQAYKSLYANISKSHLDRKLALQLIGDFVEKTEVTTDPKTQEEKKARVAELLQRLNKTHNPGQAGQDKQLPD
jgi:arylsulfatase A-like enzyme